MRRAAAILISIFVATGLGVMLPSAGHAAPGDANCTAGSYNYRQTITGGCAWGNNRVSGKNFTFNFVVRDTKGDSSCARAEVKNNIYLAPDVNRSYRICGAGSRTTAQGTMYYQPGSQQPGGVATGQTRSYDVRLCVGDNCTSWKRYFP